MRRFFARRWPWIVSTSVHAVVGAVIALNLLDIRSKAASAPVQIEVAPILQLATLTETPRLEMAEVKPPDETVNERRLDEIPPAEPIPQLAEVPDVMPIETKAIPPPPPKPLVKPAPVVAKASPPPAPPTPAPPVEAPVQTAASAAPAAPPQLAALPPAVGRPGADADYFAVILAWLEKHKEYPRQAQLRRMQGTVVLNFELDRRGHVLSYQIRTSSGFPELDREVEAMIKRAEPLPPMPADMVQAKLELLVPVQFRLR